VVDLFVAGSVQTRPPVTVANRRDALDSSRLYKCSSALRTPGRVVERRDPGRNGVLRSTEAHEKLKMSSQGMRVGVMGVELKLVDCCDQEQIISSKCWLCATTTPKGGSERRLGYRSISCDSSEAIQRGYRRRCDDGALVAAQIHHSGFATGERL
jgi:hypothetical protein